MRIVTRPDFDGIVCAVLLKDALNISEPVKWVEPNDMQHGLVEILPGDIIANLAYHENCSMWFDHHESNRIAQSFKGIFKIAPSAAGIVFEYFNDVRNRTGGFNRDYTRLVKEADKIDSASLLIEEVLHPELNPYVALSSTISSRNAADEPYWNRLVDMLRRWDIETVIKDKEISQRMRAAVEKDKSYRVELENYTTLNRHVTITDFRPKGYTPSGNRFLVFSLFPEAVVNVKIRYNNNNSEKVVISIGLSIFNRGCHVSAGEICSLFGGGGHRGAGSCSVPKEEADSAIETILDILLKNEASSFRILYEDNHLIAAHKPPGLLSVGKRVVNYQGKLFPVFPLGREASGIILFAKSEKVKKLLTKKADQGEVKRRFYALVQGKPPQEKHSIYLQIKRSDSQYLLQLESVTHDEPLPYIRKQLSSINCTLLGDKVSGTVGALNRLGLHAYLITFDHPISGEPTLVETSMPQSFLKHPL